MALGNNTENVLIGLVISIACEKMKVRYYIHRKDKYISINSPGLVKNNKLFMDLIKLKGDKIENAVKIECSSQTFQCNLLL